MRKGFLNIAALVRRLLWLSAILTTNLFALTAPISAQQTITAHGDVNLTATAADFDAGEKISTNNTINWTSGVAWEVTVKSLDANLGQSDDMTYTKPLSDLQWKLSSGSIWASITTSDVTVQTGSPNGGSGSFDVDYKFLLAWASDKPGSYGATLQYTITAQ